MARTQSLPTSFHFRTRLPLGSGERLLRRVPIPIEGAAGLSLSPFDFSDGVRRICDDIVVRVPALYHVRPERILFTFTMAKNSGPFGLQARTTPLRFPQGQRTTRKRGMTYRVQSFHVDGCEMLYFVTFCLPRFLDQPFHEKLVTIVHELYHIAPEFNGDLRRLEGRCCHHSTSKQAYDAEMGRLVQKYLQGHPNPELFSFLMKDSARLDREHGGIVGISLPRPMIVPDALG